MAKKTCKTATKIHKMATKRQNHKEIATQRQNNDEMMQYDCKEAINIYKEMINIYKETQMRCKMTTCWLFMVPLFHNVTSAAGTQELEIAANIVLY